MFLLTMLKSMQRNYEKPSTKILIVLLNPLIAKNRVLYRYVDIQYNPIYEHFMYALVRGQYVMQ